MQVKTVILPKWYWKMLGEYNGFTGQERINGWRLVKFLIAQKMVENPVGKPCEICGTIHETNYHNENYLRTLEAIHSMQTVPFCTS